MLGARQQPARGEGLPQPDRSAGESGRLQIVAATRSLGLTRSECLVCIPVAGALSVFRGCLLSVLRHTPLEVPILVADDAGPEAEMMALLRELEDEGLFMGNVYYWRSTENLGLVQQANLAMAAARPADILLLNSDCVVAEGWYDGMRAAAYADSNIATASALTNNGTILTIPGCGSATGGALLGPTLAECAAAIGASSLHLRPRIPTAVGHCMYIRRSALDLVGDFDMAFSPGYGEEVDLSQRCTERGLTHVAADDVFVWHEGGMSFSRRRDRDDIRNRHEQLLATRYPIYHAMADAAATSTVGPLARARTVARQAISGVSITIDIGHLVSTVNGTHVYALELIRALARAHPIPIRVVVSRNVDDQVRELLADSPSVDIRYVDEIGPEVGQTDVVHRPFQAPTPTELERLRWLGKRIVITQLDMIAYRNPTYHADYQSWREYCRNTSNALAASDMVVFLSRHGADDAIAEDIVDPRRTRVIPLGIDHHHFSHTPPVRPPGLGRRTEPYLLCLGTDFMHKNRLFAMETMAELQRRHDWAGTLVMAGPKAATGSSASAEASYWRANRRVSRASVDLSEIGEAEKTWLLANAAAVLCPTIYEGFGLVPFEAAALGVPSVFAAQTALGEVLPREAALLIPWDAAATADNVHHLLTNSDAAAAVLTAIQMAGDRFTWEGVAESALNLYSSLESLPPRTNQELPYMAAPAPATERELFGINGVLPAEVEEAIWALYRRPRTARTFFLGMRQMHRVGKSAMGVIKRRRLRRRHP